MTRVIVTSAAVLLGALALSACQKTNQAPDDPGVCYQVVEQPGGKLKFNVVKKDVPTLENCAAELDAVRYRFLRLGSPKHDFTGAYGGKFLFLDQNGMRITMGPSYDSPQFQTFSRGPDGRLSIPSYIPQPGPVEADGALVPKK
ncbi:MAG: hypothetical protein JSR45_15545 [Proteobacteria bacterium]|nr:hypothetical protein [Pseudomonadota bacterium]